eukprot:2178420-Prymnesium_polylepis.1
MAPHAPADPGGATLGVLAVFKDEAHGMLEWLLHYTLKGVSQFVLLDQASSDNGAAIAAAFAHAHCGQVAVSIHPVEQDGQQVAHYNRHLHLLCAPNGCSCATSTNSRSSAAPTVAPPLPS